MTAPMVSPAPLQAVEPQNPEAERLARIRRNLDRLKRAGAPPEHVQTYLQSEQTTPAQELAKMPPDAAPMAPLGDFMAGVGAVGANAASGLPGGKAAMGRLRSIGSHVTAALGGGEPISYRDALSDIDQSKALLPGAARIPLEIAGGVAGGGGLVKAGITAPWKVGAAFGGLTEALDAEPDQSLGSRALETAGGAALGAAIPRVAETGANFARKAGRAIASPFRLRTPAQIATKQTAARTAASAGNYAQAIAEGRAQSLTTPAITQVLANPELKPIVARLRQLEAFKTLGKKDVSPELLDNLYKALSDAESALKSGVAAAAGNKSVNMKTAELGNIRALKDQLVAAMDPVMPSYRTAIAEHAARSGEINATKRGADAVRIAMQPSTTGKRLTTDSPEAIEKWLKTASAEEREAFAEAASAQAARLIRTGIVPRSVFDLIGIPYRISKATAAGDRMVRAAQGKLRSAQIPRLLSPAAIAAKDATNQR